MLELAYLTVVHGRHEIVRRSLAHIAELAARMEMSGECRLTTLAVLSPEDAQAISPVCDAAGIRWIRWPNRPLSPISRKHQAGLDALREFCQTGSDVKAVIYAGSDDFLSIEYVRFAARRIGRGWIGGFGPDRCWILDAETGRMGLWRSSLFLPSGNLGKKTPCGAGRVFGRVMLDAVDWQVWPFDADRKLDLLSGAHLEKAGFGLDLFDPSTTPGVYVVDVKTSENLHPWTVGREKPVGIRNFEPITDEAECQEICRACGIDPAWWISKSQAAMQTIPAGEPATARAVPVPGSERR